MNIFNPSQLIRSSLLNENFQALADGTAIEAGAITNAKLSTTAGEPGGVWRSWTPTFTNLASGTLNYAKYTVIGTTVHYRIKYSLTGANISGAVKFTAPVKEHSDYDQFATTPLGSASLRDAGTAVIAGTVVWDSTGVFEVRAFGVSGAYVNQPTLSSTVPFTWTSTDQIHVYGTYERA